MKILIAKISNGYVVTFLTLSLVPRSVYFGNKKAVKDAVSTFIEKELGETD